MSDVLGVCPMGCGQTLFLGDGGFVTCSWIECPDPEAAYRLLTLADKARRIDLCARAVINADTYYANNASGPNLDILVRCVAALRDEVAS